MQHGRLLKKDKKKILDVIKIMDHYNVANIHQVQNRLDYLNKEIYKIESGINRPYDYKKNLKVYKNERDYLIEVISVMQRYDAHTRNDMKKELDNIAEDRNKGYKRILGIIAFVVVSLAIPTISGIQDIVGEDNSGGSSVEKYDLTEYEINQFITSYNEAYTEAIANKLNSNKEPVEYFEDIIVKDSPYKTILNQYIKDNYDINKYKFTANYKDGVYYKDKGILLINHAVIDSEVIGGEKTRRPEGEVNRAAFEIEVKVIDGNKKILIKDKLKNEEIDSRLSLT